MALGNQRNVDDAALEYKDLYEEFVGRVTSNTYRYVGIFADAIDELIPKPTEALQDDDHDILMTQRAEGNENADGADPKQKMPLEIKRFNKGVWKCVCKIDYAFVEFANLRSALLA
ncbi:hypothetical protein Tco_1115386 [Tanacetum coccineum]